MKQNLKQVNQILISLLIFTLSSLLPAEANRGNDLEIREKHYIVISFISEDLEAFQNGWFGGSSDISARVLIRMMYLALKSEEYRKSKSYLCMNVPLAEFLSRKDRFAKYRDRAFEIEYNCDLADISTTEQDRMLRRFRDLVTEVYTVNRDSLIYVRFSD